MDQQPHDVIPQVIMPQQSAEAFTNSAETMVAANNEVQAASNLEQGRSSTGVVNLPSQMIGTIDPVVGQPAALPVSAPTAQPAVAAMPGIADDTDLIEKEWVEKAKSIVAQTKHDPYVQNTELSKMKADYMKKRYNKDLRLT